MIHKEWTRFYNKYRSITHTQLHIIQVITTALYQRILAHIKHRLNHLRSTPPLSQITAPLTHITHRCVLCEDSSPQRLCLPCQQQFFTSPPHQCSCCALPLTHSALFCGECLKARPAFKKTISAAIYQPPLSTLLLRCKHSSDHYAGRALAELLLAGINTHYRQHHLPLPTLLAPVPLHWKRQWRRGFNQSSVLAQYLSRHLSIPLFSQTQRLTAAPSQQGLSRKQRLHNMKNSFTIKQRFKEQINEQDIAIIDDVMTTGATANTFATALLKAGARQVTVWIVARTPKPH